jgi:hypothetical protein
MLDTWKFVGRPKLAPANAGQTVVDERSMSLPRFYSTLLRGSVAFRGMATADTLGMEVHTPTATPYAIVTLDKPREIRPRRFVECSHVEVHHASISATAVSSTPASPKRSSRNRPVRTAMRGLSLRY